MTIALFKERLANGDGHERRVEHEFKIRDFTVDKYGQGILAETTRNALKLTDSRMRWDPDLIVSRGRFVALIDAKTSLRGPDADLFMVSKRALGAHRRMCAELDLPLYYVFANLGVATPDEVMSIRRLTTVGEAGAYISIGSGLVRPFDDVFGPPKWTQTMLKAA